MADDKQQKRVVFEGSSREALSAFPKDAKRDIGFQLERMQEGLEPNRWKPMNRVGRGVIEIIVDTGDAFRVFCVAKFQDAIHVLHAFQKTTRKTSKHDIDIGKQRYRKLAEAIAKGQQGHRSGK